MKKIMMVANYEVEMQFAPFGFDCMNHHFINEGDFGHVTSSVLFSFQEGLRGLGNYGYQRSYAFNSNPHGTRRVDSLVFETGFDFSERE